MIFFEDGKGWDKEFREIREFKEIKEFKEFREFKGFREFSRLFIT